MPLPIKKGAVAESILTRTVSKAEIFENFDEYQKALSFFRAYPDR